MTVRFAVFIGLLLALLCAPSLSAQETPPDTAEVRRLVLTDGSIYVGRVVDAEADPVVIVTDDGLRREFPQARVEEITPLINGRFFRTDPVRTSHIVAPTAHTQGAGNTRLNLSLLGPGVTIGLTDRLDLTASGYLIAADEFAVSPLVGLKGQVVRSENIQVALGVSAPRSPSGKASQEISRRCPTAWRPSAT